MKPTLLLFTCLFFKGFSYGQEHKETLSEIKNKYLVIREYIADDILKAKQLDYDCSEETQQGNLTFYYNSNELKHILHNYNKGLVSYKDEYYVWDNELFFAFSTYKINRKETPEPTSEKQKLDTVLVMEERFYFKKEQPIKCLFKSFKMFSTQEKDSITDHIRNKIVDCTESERIKEKYNLLLSYKHLLEENTCDLPKNISELVKPKEQLEASFFN